jgi:glycosyltransferase involved in cell wall biosynthesis
MRLTYLADIRMPLERANGIQTVETCHALARRGHEVTLITRPDTHTPRRDPYVYYGLPRIPGFAIEQAPVAGPAFARRVGYIAFALGRALGRARPDVLFTRDLGVAALFAQLPPAMAPPLVYESHGYAPDVAAELPQLISTAVPASARKLRRLAAREALVWRRAAGYVTITKTLEAVLIERFGPRDNLAVVPDGVRLDPERQWVPPPQEDPPIVAYAGHLYAWKGVDVLLDAIALTPSIRGLIVGGHESEGDLARLRAQAARLGLADRVTFTGMVPPGTIPSLLATAHVLVLPNTQTVISSVFTSPLKLFEYMAAGRPIVASDLPAIREVLADNVNAVLVAAGDPLALSEGLKRALDRPGDANRLALRAFDDAADFSWDRRAARLDAVIERAKQSR